MQDKRHISEVEKALKEAFKGDKARIRTSKISSFGLMELSRQRLRPTLESSAYDVCPQCKGTGKVKSAEAQALQVYRKIQGAAAKGNLVRVEGDLPVLTGTHLLNDMRRELASLEQEFGIQVRLSIDPRASSQEARLRLVRTRKAGDGEYVEEVNL